MYGKSANINSNDSNVDKSMIIEYAELLEIEEKSNPIEPQIPNNNSNNNSSFARPDLQFGVIEMDTVPISTKSAPLPSTTPTKAITKQIETRRADGKRRITPMFIPLSSEQET